MISILAISIVLLGYILIGAFWVYLYSLLAKSIGKPLGFDEGETTGWSVEILMFWPIVIPLLIFAVVVFILIAIPIEFTKPRKERFKTKEKKND